MLKRMCTWVQHLKLIVRLLHCLPTNFSQYYLYTGQFGSNWTPLTLSNLVILLCYITCYTYTQILQVSLIQLFTCYVTPICEATHFLPVLLFHPHPLQHAGGISGTACSVLFIMSSWFVCLIFHVSPPENFHRYEIQRTKWPTVWSNSGQSS